VKGVVLRRKIDIFAVNSAEIMAYIYQNTDWPNFVWDAAKLTNLLAEVTHRQGRLLGRMESLGFHLQSEAALEAMTVELIKSNEIEGQSLDVQQVRSSIARRLGLDIAGLVPSDRHVDGLVEVVLDATRNYLEPLSKDRLCSWQAVLFPSGRSGMHKIVVGDWRKNEADDPMQVVSGPMGKEQVHFQAPDSELLDKEMRQFIHWFNTSFDVHPLLKAAISHLWFVTIHPFDDGNGRMARSITDMQLARADNTPQRFYSMSAQIRLERNQYYTILERTQRGTLDITVWLEWFLECLNRSLMAADTCTGAVIKKSLFWEYFATKNLNDRQRMMLNRLLDGFIGKLNSSKWSKLAKCSQDTALRDIQDLISQNILIKEPDGGRSTSYTLAPINKDGA
jgi:Fic family protein